MTEPSCPVCLETISLKIVTMLRAFRCPHCGELLRESRLGTGNVAGVVIPTFALLLYLTGRVGWVGQMLTIAAASGVVAVVHAAVVQLLGYTLEPVGRVALGESEDGD